MTFAPSTVSITREFDDPRPAAEPGIKGIRGTAWFLSSRSIVTAAHVAEAMHLSATAWTTVTLRERENEQTIAARIQRIAGRDAEKLAVLELDATFARAIALTLRSAPLVPEEPLVAIAYTAGQLRQAVGRFVGHGSEGNSAGAMLLELYDGNDRLALDHGASGAPVLDCEGRLVAVVSNVFSQTLRFQAQAMRISTPWGSPNIAALPTAALTDLNGP
jgi:S1-C subfamily serine protease